MTEVHSCSYHCDRPECVKAQRDELRSRLAQPEQEPVAHTLNCVCGAVWDVGFDGVEKMVHAPNPPQRKPLTHPQIHELDWPDGVSFEDILPFVRSIEAAHGIKGKNT